MSFWPFTSHANCFLLWCFIIGDIRGLPLGAFLELSILSNFGSFLTAFKTSKMQNSKCKICISVIPWILIRLYTICLYEIDNLGATAWVLKGSRWEHISRFHNKVTFQGFSNYWPSQIYMGHLWIWFHLYINMLLAPFVNIQLFFTLNIYTWDYQRPSCGDCCRLINFI